ncbi:hypothetical protein [Arcanobacterium hippocoleae]|uniref:Phage protein n=1 Tax=Arcanobacterium hippocoleae TaxID=149017 RepID=A0ABU1T1R2_9ACTO|nr:hypothetical protein [Arcanobacterium hippocoleae]MDR6939221.1 hypothetical protein [Arcanobacterium hippocoleae]
MNYDKILTLRELDLILEKLAKERKAYIEDQKKYEAEEDFNTSLLVQGEILGIDFATLIVKISRESLQETWNKK